jgi:predicted amidophosphoribosyltransferase
MMYQLCPRCQFKIALNKHVCGTCGLNISAYNTKFRQNFAQEDSHKSKTNTSLANLFSTFGQKSKKIQDNRHEEPALGEI